LAKSVFDLPLHVRLLAPASRKRSPATKPRSTCRAKNCACTIAQSRKKDVTTSKQQNATKRHVAVH